MMNNESKLFLLDHARLTRRWFMQLGTMATAFAGLAEGVSADDNQQDKRLNEAIAKLESFMTKQVDFRDVSRGNPLPHRLSDDKKAEVGLTRDSWRLEVISDPERPAKLAKQFTISTGNALTFDDLLKLIESNTFRIPKIITCLNHGCPAGMGVWEGVPMRDILWLTEPKEDLRRVFYYGYHNDDPQQLFRSSLPVSRVLEDPFDLPPVILCTKLNGEWLTSERGGPVRVIVPEHYGFKSIKWLTTIVLSNIEHANDTYANGNNDLDSPLKSFAATLNAPSQVPADQPFPITGYAQVGISGVKQVQVAIHRDEAPPPTDDKQLTSLTWLNAQILDPPTDWGGGLQDGRIPEDTFGFEAGLPKKWPLPLSKIHWAILYPALPTGNYTLRVRTVDNHDQAQPMPRPFRKSGHAAIEMTQFKVG